MGFEAKQITGVDREFHIQVYILTDFWDNIKEANGGGRGYYRNISLVNAWAHAPFMHNNAIGPELCGNPGNDLNNFYNSPYVDDKGELLANPPPCVPYDQRK